MDIRAMDPCTASLWSMLGPSSLLRLPETFRHFG